MKRIVFSCIVALVALALACTSSNTGASVNTNNNYDSNYRSISGGGQAADRQTTPEETPVGDPPITIMLMGMETGDVYPGDDYFVWAVVDNPDNRNLEYVWSVANGDTREVPEADRGRLMALVEEEYKTAQEGPAPSLEPLPLTEPEGQVPPEGTPPPIEQPTEGTRERPEGAALPGESTATTTGTEATGSETVDDYDPFANVGTGGNLDTSGGGSQSGDQSGELTGDEQQLIDASQDIAFQIKMLEEELQELIDSGGDPEEIANLQRTIDELKSSKPSSTAGSAQTIYPGRLPGSVQEYRVVAGPDDETDDEADGEEEMSSVELLAEQLAEDATDAGDSVITFGADNGSNVAEGDSSSTRSWVGSETPDLSPGRARGIRSEYEVWKDDSVEPRRRNLGGYGESDYTESLTAEDSYDVHTFVTDEPYIQWTPQLPGSVNIYLKVRYKDEYVTDEETPRELPVEVRLRDPEVSLSEEFPDVVREDEPMYVVIDGTNIPSFYKGLFTLTFDGNKLSFRDAELGEFFDDVPSASLFYAQPDKLAGKVLLAVDSNKNIGELAGNGELVYVKFKAKQDLTSRAETQLALVMDTTARYILNRAGENILPLPVTTVAYRTDTIMPPDMSQWTDITDRPGSQTGETQTASRPAEGTTTGGTYVPPATGTTYSGGTGGVYSGTESTVGGNNTGGRNDTGGSDTGGTDNGGTDNGGTDNSGTDNGGTDNGGTDNGGTDNGGTDNGGTDNSGTDNGGNNSGKDVPLDMDPVGTLKKDGSAAEGDEGDEGDEGESETVEEDETATETEGDETTAEGEGDGTEPEPEPEPESTDN